MSRRRIYLHWTATAYQWVQPGHYHSIITGDGVLHRMHDYNIDLTAHTWRRNSNAIALACACMGGADPWMTPPTPAQLDSMCAEVARVIRSWGWQEADISINSILTHAEAASNRDGWIAHENYGPQAWGGTGERWDLMCLTRGGSDDGGEQLRERIRACFRTDQSPPAVDHPLDHSRAATMTVREQPLEVRIDTAGVTWARAATLLNRYGIPFIWDAPKRRILIGASDVIPRYSQDRVVPQPGLPLFELASQGGHAAVILTGLIHQQHACCQVLEFADAFGISASFNPFVLHQRRGG